MPFQANWRSLWWLREMENQRERDREAQEQRDGAGIKWDAFPGGRSSTPPSSFLLATIEWALPGNISRPLGDQNLHGVEPVSSHRCLCVYAHWYPEGINKAGTYSYLCVCTRVRWRVHVSARLSAAQSMCSRYPGGPAQPASLPCQSVLSQPWVAGTQRPKLRASSLIDEQGKQ